MTCSPTVYDSVSFICPGGGEGLLRTNTVAGCQKASVVLCKHPLLLQDWYGRRRGPRCHFHIGVVGAEVRATMSMKAGWNFL